MKALFLSFFLLVLMPLGANAAGCYTPVEAEAEQGVKIHSELMVIGLNCTHMGKREGMDLYGDYRRFTADHSDLFARYEEILLNHFKKNGGGKPEAQLNTLRTGFANKISEDVAAMRPDVFCSRYAPRILAAKKMTRTDVRKWAATVHKSHPVSKPMCAGG